MTGIISHPPRSARGGLQPNLLTSVEPAASRQTRDITRRVQALRSHPSPGSLRSDAAGRSDGKSLHERLFDALADVKILTSQVAMHLEREWRDRLFRLLDSLHNTEEWEAGDEPIRKSSYVTFLKAILNIKPDRRPGLGLTPEGYLIATWTTGEDRLTIVFLPYDRVRWVLSRHYDDDAERFAGDTGVARLADGLMAHHPEHWFSHALKDPELAQ
jgi:hypothetical protein